MKLLMLTIPAMGPRSTRRNSKRTAAAAAEVGRSTQAPSSPSIRFRIPTSPTLAPPLPLRAQPPNSPAHSRPSARPILTRSKSSARVMRPTWWVPPPPPPLLLPSPPLTPRPCAQEWTRAGSTSSVYSGTGTRSSGWM